MPSRGDVSRWALGGCGLHLYGVLADDEDAHPLAGSDGQHVALVAQQHDSLVAYAAGCVIMLLAAERAETGFRVHGCEHDQAQDAARLVVEFGGTDLARGDEVEVWLSHIVVVVGVAGAVGKAVGPAAELQVEAVGNGLRRVVRAAPVAHHDPLESPFLLEDVVEHPAVVAEVLVAVEVVGPHDAPGVALGDGCLEGRQVDFVEGSVVDYNVGRVAVHLVVVEREMLDAGGDAAALQALDVGHHHTRGQTGVLAHVFEVTAVERRAVDVDAGAENHVLASVAGLLAERAAVEPGHVGIPCRRQAGECREGDARVVRLSGLLPFVLHGHARERVLDALVERPRGVGEGPRHVGAGPCAESARQG